MFLSDEDILTIFKDENRKSYAFDQLVRKYQQKVYWTVRRMVIDHEDANDITQDIFIKVWNKLSNFRGEARLYTWIYRIAINDTLNFLNSRKRKLFIPLVSVEKTLEEEIESSEYFSGDEIQVKLQKAILQLPEKQRIVFNLRYYDELSYEEMSAVLKTSVGALKASYHHAVRKLEKILFEND